MNFAKASADDIAAMKSRLSQRQADRKAEADIEEAIALASRKAGPFGEARTAQIEAEAVEPEERKTGMAASLFLLAGYGVSEAMRRMTAADGLVLLILWLIGFVVYGISKGGAL